MFPRTPSKNETIAPHYHLQSKNIKNPTTLTDLPCVVVLFLGLAGKPRGLAWLDPPGIVGGMIREDFDPRGSCRDGSPHASGHGSIRRHLQGCLKSMLEIGIHTYIHTYIHTCIHADIYIYSIYTYLNISIC